MRYDELVKIIIDKKMMVICCIDSHFTAFYVIAKDKIIYYDPLQSDLILVNNDDSC